jgi:hypothetical protein
MDFEEIRTIKKEIKYFNGEYRKDALMTSQE